ncbi:unnamed protein product [Adineta steineri]|uniref:Protein kinase domain-containing protein n=1 Tax=Adineta steineri TaxID=433720 RepID=A0A813Y9I6_9BILA|nr:unnamed protein product [Adineta steineri]CAF3696482.1 unnamed protein product [Adineta steineri]
MYKEIILILILKITIINCYAFQSSIDNLLYIKNTSTLFAISSSHLYQLHWSTTNQTLLLLHRRVQLHSTIDNTEYGVSVFVYDQVKQLLIICARSIIGRCILYDANDISRTYLLESSLETNYLGCLSGCYTFMSSNIIRSALNGNRLEHNGNIINSKIELRNDLLNYNIKYELESSDNTLITSLTFLPERLINKYNYEYIYGFDYQQYTYYILKSSRIARLCQSSIAMRVTYDEIPLLNCNNDKNSSIITGAYYSLDKMNHLYILFDNIVCIYTMNEILRAFKESKAQCQSGNGYRLSHIVDSVDLRPTCEKTLDQNLTEINECTWQAYRTNTYMDGIIGAIGEKIYETMTKNIKIRFIFAQDDIVILSTNERRILKFIRSNQTTLYLLHEAIYQSEPFNSQYVIDYEHESLIFAVASELHRYAYNSCSIYDTCRSCIGSRRYDSKSCIWFDGKCSLTSNPLILNRGCPPSIDQIKPTNISVNSERISLKITGIFENVQAHLAKVTIKYPLSNQNESVCTIKTIKNDSLICDLIVPKQSSQGMVSIYVKSEHSLAIGDTDISGTVELTEKLNIYIPKPILVPNFGPAAGGTKIRIQNLAFDNSLDLFSIMKIFLGRKQCHITEITTDAIECINEACTNNLEKLELHIQVHDYIWQLQKTYFHCRSDPMVFDWSPKKSILSGGIKLTITGEYLDVVQIPMMKFVYNLSDFEFISLCESISNSQMICLSPTIDKNLGLSPPIDLDVTFYMDNIKIIPDNNVLTIVNDPIYYPFENYIQEINSTHIIKFQGSNLAATHSMDLINIRIDNINNACIPFNFTNTYLMCRLSKLALKNIQDSEANIDIQIGTNLTFLIGKILFQNNTSSSTTLLIVPYLTRQIGSWTIIILTILTSITILTLLFLLVIFIRRRFFQSPEKYHKQNKPPQYYQDVWCELGKKWQINSKYLTVAEKIGQGCFGDVYRGELKQNDNKSIDVAIKVLRDQNVASMHEFLFEANRMKDFSHSNVLSLIGVVWDPIRKAMVLLPYMKNGDLRSYISNEKNRPTVRQLITWGIQVADGMEYLSSLKFIHRDLATRNCMLDENLICRISDFGLSRDIIDRDYYLVPRTTTKEKDGQAIQIPPRRLPIRWLSPESIESSKYTVQSDVWSYGILLWELLSRGKTPYPGIDNADIFTYIKNGYRLPQPTYCPPLLYKSAMLVCWNADSNQRPSFTQLAQDIRQILLQLEIEQQKQYIRPQQSSSADDDTIIVERYPGDRKIKRLSTTSMSSSGSIGGQYITTPHRQSENVQLLFDRGGDDEDAYAVQVNSSPDIFSTTRLLPKYTETSITEDV